MAGSILPPPVRMESTGPGCCVRHHSIDFQTIMTSVKAKIESTAQNRARCDGSVTASRNIKYAAYSNQQTSIEVSQASHVHQIPQMMRAQMLPVTSTTVANARPTSVEAAAMA